MLTRRAKSFLRVITPGKPDLVRRSEKHSIHIREYFDLRWTCLVGRSGRTSSSYGIFSDFNLELALKLSWLLALII